MTALFQRLKELSKEDFESLLDQLLQAKYPGAGIMRVEGTGGDEGIDNFQGNLSDGPAVWQHKHFPNRIQKTQRKQILKSIEAAFKSRTPRRWVLCVPINLRTTEHNWFQQSVEMPYERGYPGCTIELMQASHIVKELLHFTTIREAFFLDAVSDIARLKALATSTENLTIEQSAAVATEYAQQYLGRMKTVDPRFDYMVTVGRDRVPIFGPEPGLVVAFQRGDVHTQVFARDLESIRLDPMTFELKLLASAGEKIRQAAETGRPQTLSPDEFVSMSSKSPLIDFLSRDVKQAEIKVVPQVPDPTKVIPLRFVFGQGADAKEIPYLPFRREYAGQREATLRSCGAVPVDVRIRLRLNKSATISFTPLIAGANVRQLQHVLDCIRALRVSPFLEALSLESGKVLFSGSAPLPSSAAIEQKLFDLIADAARVSRHFGVELTLPEKIIETDLYALLELRRIATGEVFEVGTLDGNLVKVGGSQEQVVMDFGASSEALVLQPQSEQAPVQLFGVTVNIGRPVFRCEKAEFSDLPELRRRYAAAKLGEVVPIKWKCVGECRFITGQTLEAAMSGSHNAVG